MNSPKPATHILTWSTALTITRIILVPFIIQAMLQQLWIQAGTLFMFAAITDFFDGLLARLLHQETTLGAYLDPIADKILIISCYSALAFIDLPVFKIPTWFFWLVVSRELMLIFSCAYFGAWKHMITIKPSRLGKYTAALQMGFIFWIILCSVYDWMPIKSLYVTLAVVLFCVLLSCALYAIQGLREVGIWQR